MKLVSVCVGFSTYMTSVNNSLVVDLPPPTTAADDEPDTGFSLPPFLPPLSLLSLLFHSREVLYKYTQLLLLPCLSLPPLPFSYYVASGKGKAAAKGKKAATNDANAKNKTRNTRDRVAAEQVLHSPHLPRLTIKKTESGNMHFA